MRTNDSLLRCFDHDASSLVRHRTLYSPLVYKAFPIRHHNCAGNGTAQVTGFFQGVLKSTERIEELEGSRREVGFDLLATHMSRAPKVYIIIRRQPRRPSFRPSGPRPRLEGASELLVTTRDAGRSLNAQSPACR